MEPKFCKKCGSPVIGCTFCGTCGTRVAGAVKVAPTAAPAAAPATPVAAAPVAPVATPVTAEPAATPATPVVAEPVAPVAAEPVAEPAAPVAPAAPTPAAPVMSAPATPVTPTYAASVAAPPKKAPARRSGSAKALSACLCALIFLLSFPLVSLLGLRAATTKESTAEIAKTAIKEMDVSEIPAASLVADEDYEGSVADWIVERVREENGGEEIFNQEEFEKYLEKSALVEGLSDKMGDVIWDIRQGEANASLDAEEIRQMLEKDRGLIEKHLHFQISQNDIDKIVTEMESSSALEYINTETLREESGGMFEALEFVLSSSLLWGVVGLMALCLALLALVNRRNISFALGDAGITFAIAGVGMLVAVLVLMSVGGSIAKSLDMPAMIASGFSLVVKKFLTPCIVMIVVGVAMIVAKIVLKLRNAVKPAN